MVMELMKPTKYRLLMSETLGYCRTHTSFFTTDLSRACPACQALSRVLGIQWHQAQHRICPHEEHLLWRSADKYRYRCGNRTENSSLTYGVRERPEELEEGEGKGSTFQGLESRGSESG